VGTHCRQLRRWHPIKCVNRTQTRRVEAPPVHAEDSSLLASIEEKPSKEESQQFGLKNLLGAYDSDG
jgi:hypothetical protein